MNYAIIFTEISFSPETSNLIQNVITIYISVTSNTNDIICNSGDRFSKSEILLYE